jgi:branched-chain amino acid transport system ATP-binding protein
MSTLLNIENLESGYGLFQAIRGLSLTAARGETVAIVGANGAGKTTLLRTICGVISPTAGSIQFDGKEIGGLPAHAVARHAIAMVPEGRKLFRSLTVEDNLIIGGFSARRGHWDLKRVYELFPELVKRRHNRGLDLSGGEQQMVAIGRALMSNPDLLLMDEISLGLAPIVINQIYKSLPQIADQGTTVIIVEQDVNRGLSVADQVHCLLEGHVSLSGTPQELDKDALSKAYFGVSA